MASRRKASHGADATRAATSATPETPATAASATSGPLRRRRSERPGRTVGAISFWGRSPSEKGPSAPVAPQTQRPCQHAAWCRPRHSSQTTMSLE